MHPLDDYLTPEQCARWLGVSRATLDELVASGTIHPIRMGQRTVRFHPATVHIELARANRVPPKVTELALKRERQDSHNPPIA